MVAAEDKQNRYGSRYTYYHCSRRRLDYRCRQPCVQVEELEKQIREFLGELAIPERFEHAAVSRLRRDEESRTKAAEERTAAVAEALEVIERKLSNLTKLRIEDHIGADEYLRELDEIERERVKLTQGLAAGAAGLERFELSTTLVSLANTAALCFVEGNRDDRRLVARICGSNFVLKNQELSVSARTPFCRWTGVESDSDVRRLVKEVRTSVGDPVNRVDLDAMKRTLEGRKHPRELKAG